MLPLFDIEQLKKGEALWIDLINPSEGELKSVETILGIDILTDEERGLEESARFFHEDKTLYLYITIPTRMGAVPYQSSLESASYQRSELEIIVSENVLITYHKHAIKALEVGKTRASARLESVNTPHGALVSIIEALIERQANFLNKIGRGIDAVSLPVLADRKVLKTEPRLRKLGQLGAQLGLCRDTLFDLARMVAFLSEYDHGFTDYKHQLGAYHDDIADLLRLNEAQSNDLSFLLDATLGLIGARQGQAVNIMAVVTLLFAPPTFIASMMGMNFSHWHIFDMPNAHYYTLIAMALSSLIVFLIAKASKLF